MGILDTVLGTGQGSGSPNAAPGQPYQPGMLGGLQAYLAPNMYQARQQGFAQQQAYDALKGTGGAPADMAGALATNPHMMQQAGGAYLPQAPEVMTVPGAFGDSPSFYKKQIGPGGQISISPQSLGNAPGTTTNPAEGAAERPSNRAPGGLSEISDALQQAKAGGANEEALLKILSDKYPAMSDMMRSILNNQEIPTHLSMRKDLRDAAIRLAPMIDPTFDEAAYPARVQAMKSWRSGKDADTVKALNQGIHHSAEVLIPAMKAMEGVNENAPPWANAVINPVREGLGGQAEPNNFRIAAHAVADELGKLWKGNNLSDTEIRAWESALSPNMSPEQMRGAVAQLMKLIEGSMSALQDKRDIGIGQRAAQKLGSLISGKGREGLDKFAEYANPAPAAPAPATQGEIRVDAQGKRWMRGPDGKVVPAP